jgi:5'-nucleotidase
MAASIEALAIRASRVRTGAMPRSTTAAALLLALGACATTPAPAPEETSPVEVKIIGFNDFHGSLEPPKRSVPAPGAAAGETVQVPAGGAAYLAAAIQTLRSRNPNNLTISAGDMIGASPLVSSIFLDEPTIHAMNLIRIDYNAVGNHEFDRGRAELLRMQKGGCEKHTDRDPCRLEPFAGARFGFLAANVVTETGKTLFPPYAMRSFGRGASEVKVAVIGMTLEATPTLVTPAGVAGLSFRDEADTVNALVPRLKAEGADAIVLLIHEGAFITGRYDDKSCPGLSGDLLPILDRLDPAVDLVVSGHTHRAYVCRYTPPGRERPILLTSAGVAGTLVTDIRLTVDPVRGVVAKDADNLIVQSEAFSSSAGPVANTDRYPRFSPDPAVAALTRRYSAAAAPLAARVVGRLTAPATEAETKAQETVLGDLVADAQLAATRASGAQVAFMNSTGVRADLVPGPGGVITYGQIFESQPFGNSLVVKSFTGKQLRALLEQQFKPDASPAERRVMLLPSAGFTYSFDLTRPPGRRITDARLNGAPLRDDLTYRVTMNSFLASGGDNFTIFREGTNQTGGPQDLDALEAYLKANDPLTPPAADRIRDLTPSTARPKP